MRGALAYSLTPAEAVPLALGGVLVFLLAAIAWRRWQASRVTPEERERRRRAMVVSIGKMGDATIVEIRGDLIFYTYDVRGVEYTASQDVSALRELLPPEPGAMVGPVFIKYDARNPANSIIIAEEWSGLRNAVRS